MRSEQDSLADLQSALMREELSYTNALIELYGTPYPDDIGPGKLYRQGYAVSDLLHFSFVDLPEFDIPEVWSYTAGHTWDFAIRDVPVGWATAMFKDVNLPIATASSNSPATMPDGSARNGIRLEVVKTGTGFQTNFYFKVDVGYDGFFQKPKDWKSRRASPGRIQRFPTRSRPMPACGTRSMTW